MDTDQYPSPGWVPGVAREAVVRLLDHADVVGLENTEEFTYRAFFMAAAHRRLQDPTFHTEWKHFDLLVRHGGEATLVEFKYYLYRRTYGLDGSLTGTKGGASLQNEQDFAACVAKLTRRVIPGITARHLVLVYQREGLGRGRRSYEASYGQPPPLPGVARVWRCGVGPLELRVLDIAEPTSERAAFSAAPMDVMGVVGAPQPAPLLWFGEDAGALWADEQHDFDPSPQRHDECALCRQDEAHH